MTAAEVLKTVPKSLSETTMLVVLNISMWSGRRLDRGASASVARQYGAASTERAGNFNKCLIPSSSLSAITKPSGELRQYHYEHTLPWLDSGARVLSSGFYMEYITHVTAFTDAMDRAADAFAADYPRLVRNARAELGGLFDSTEYPHPSDVRKKFGAQLQILPFPDAQDFRVPLTMEHADAIRASISAATEQTIDVAVKEVAQRALDVAGAMADRLKAYNVGSDGKVTAPFRDSLVGNIEHLLSVIPALDIAADPRIAKIKEQLSALIRDPDDLRDDEALRGKIAEKADKLARHMGAYL